MTVRVAILNPFATAVVVESGFGHHHPYADAAKMADGLARDLDCYGPSIGAPVSFIPGELPAGFQVRGRVESVGPACRTGNIADGGYVVSIDLEHCRTSEGVWWPSDRRVWYAHLDPVLVAEDQIILPDTVLGRLGPSAGAEYNSPCAQGSHLHLEVSGGEWGAAEDVHLAVREAAIRLDLVATPPAGPAVTLDQRVAELDARLSELERWRRS